MLIKSSLTLGAITGAILGVILLIPFINSFSCFILFTVVGAGIIFYLKKNSFIGVLSLQDGAMIGAISGFISLITASLVYLPASYILSLIFSPLSKAGGNILSSFIVTSYSIFVMIMLVFFMALLSALFNAFCGLIAAYIYEKIENIPIKEEDEFIIEQ
ncbi:MAG: hypothetical protein PHC34_03210 [Candidatus Gastranaerophilales bacterium]|nr:hypothetical protein [Candidatus Gastranaerophilales bacterium]